MHTSMKPTYFASGSNRAADIRGFAAVGHAIGVAAPEVSPAAERELVALAGKGIPVFVDSGAFSEVEFGATGVTVVAEITDAEWRIRLDLYRRLAVALGSQVHVVAPDMVGNQEETLRRLTKYAPELAYLRALGANVLVPIQKGTKTQAEFVVDVIEALGFDDFVHAIPSRKKATTLAELKAYCTAVQPKRIHLLGMGIKNANARAALAAIESCSPGCVVSLDSNAIAASVGRGGVSKSGKKKSPRKLTIARVEAARMIAAGETSIKSKQELGIILVFGTPEDIARATAQKVSAA